jgi:hypothetical protein
MVESPAKRSLRPVRMLATAITAGLAMVAAALAWPTLVQADTQPVITQVQVTSSKGTFFYSLLTDTGGSVYFNNLDGEGADQVITVTVTVSDDNPAMFSGGYAFGITPTTSVSNTDGTWSVTYTVHSTDTTENGVLFAVTDGNCLSSTVTITFTQDISDPSINEPHIDEASPYLYAVGTGIYYGDDMGTTSAPFTVTGMASDSGVGLERAAFSSALDTTPPDDTTPAAWTGVYSADNSSSGTGTIVVTVTDHVGNAITQTFAYTQDTTAPSVAFTDFTAAQYVTGTTNWYRTPALTAGWAFTAAFTETDAGFDSSLAAWDHQTSSADDQTILPTPSGPATLTGTFTHVYTNADGAVDVTLIVTDHVGNSANASIALNLDGSSPVISSPEIIENSRYLYAVGTGIYYGDGMGSTRVPFTVTGEASDSGVGLDHAAFSPALGSPSAPPDDTTPATWTGVYSPNNSSTGTDTIVVTVTDHVGNAITQTFAYTRDITPPSIPADLAHVPDIDSHGDGFDPDTNWEDDTTISMTWSSSTDSESGLRTYHLSTSSGPTTPDVPQNSSITVPTDGAYTIFVNAEDNVGNISPDKAYGSIYVDRDTPSGARLNLSEVSGGQYLYIANMTGITGGTLYYNNAATSSFVVTGDVSSINWGMGSEAWKVAFDASWGDPQDEVTTEPYTHTYTVNPGETDNGFTVFFVNEAGNVQAITIANTLDVTAPLVNLIDVTNPVYDPDHDELDNTGNWYRTSALTAGWTFTSSVSDTLSGLGSSLAVWNHSVPSNNQTIDPGLDGSATFSNVYNDSDGVVTVTVTLTDHVNNAASDSVVIRLDSTAPTIDTGSWGESSPYLALVGGVLYYNPTMPVTQTATLNGTASDAGSELDYATFSQSLNLPSTPISDTSPATWSTVYSFSSATQGNYVNVVAYDHVGNAFTATYAYTSAPGLPVVSFTNVTDPGYDPYGTELDTQGNWYASKNFVGGFGSQGWSFYAIVTDGSGTGISAAGATWDHATGPDYALTPSVVGGIIYDAFEYLRSDPDGLVTVTLTVTDNLGQVATDTIALHIDNTPPSITSGGWSEGSPYLFANGSTLYFSQQMGATLQTAILSGTATESGGAGLWKAVFSDEGSFGSEATDYSPANWSNPYYVSASSLDTNSPIDVVVSDNLGNAVTRTFTYTRDTTPPAVLLTDVTNPQYDPDGNELNTTDNWYRTSALDSGWSFTATVTETVAGVGQDQAVWDYQAGTDDDRYTTLGLSGAGVFANRTGTFAGEIDTPDGVVTVTLAVTDRVGNVGSDFVVVRLDGSPAVITPTGWSESSPYLYADGDTLYFSDLMGSTTVPATVSGTASDAGVGLSLATFSYEPSLYSSPGSDAEPSTWSGTYGVRSSSSGTSSPVLVTVYDLVSNTITTTFNYVKDTALPTVSFTDVTNPQYDPDGNELNAAGNWYRTSLLTGGWAFTGTIADSLAGPWYAQATWDHDASCPTCDQTIDPGLDGDGVFTGVYTNSDGTVVVWLRGTDNVSNTNVDSLTIRLDNTPPGLPSNFQVTSPGLPGGYYSTTLLSLQWNSASDPLGSGVAAHLLGTTPSPTATYTSPASYNVAGDGVYSFYLRATDNVGNLGAVASTGPITVDTHAPTPLSLQATPKDSENRILVGWGASDATTWPVAYDVEYSLTGTGDWQGWITNTSSISTYFGPDTPAHVEMETTYCFRMRARDYVGNESGWSSVVCTALGRKFVFLPIIARNYDASIPYFTSGDFESGTFDGWNTGGALPRSIVTHPVLPTGGTPANGGTYAARLGNPSYGCSNVPVGQAYIKAYVNVPAGTSHLRFDYRVLSYDTVKSKGEWWDRLEVQVNGTPLARYGDSDLNVSCDSLYDSGWKTANFDLSAYAGQIILLTFFNENHGDNWYNTWSYLDNIRIETP